ncbi:MAG: TonB-dependent receptor [Candidatus Marinimicrobia bacterium]|nr:TonB-dependent receptor [Candidatus Neomarinimicrobiota bacterium]MCF7828536.1 TonB-dependent receptor [Candidatus Neomarinimicrobiota bacterium]MCF7882041.1 TonB-dependent receptor [Candidatus Neomarinimicrobiota bacterium]
MTIQQRYWMLFFFAGILLVTGTAVFGESIHGYVRNAETGEGIPYVNVFIEDTTLGTITNRDGYYVIPQVPVDSLTVIARYIGYETGVRPVLVHPGERLRINFQLAVKPISGEEVEITAEQQRFRNEINVSMTSLDMREIKTAPTVFEADIFRTVQHLPGVKSISDFSSALYVRGSTPDQNLILLDGITVYNPYHLGGLFSTFNTEAIKTAEFHAGGFPAKYGSRMGAVLDITNKEGNSQEFSGQADVSLISSKLFLEGPLKKNPWVKGSWMVAGRRTYYDILMEPIFYFVRRNNQDQGDLANIRFPYYFYDFQGKVNLDFSPDHRLTLSSFYGDDVFHIYSDSDDSANNPDNQYQYSNMYRFDWRWGNRTNSATWRWILSPKLVMKTYLAGSRFRFWIDFDEQSEGWETVTEDDSTWSYTWKNSFTMDIGDIVKNRSGKVEFTWQPTPAHVVTSGVQYKQLGFLLGMVFGGEDMNNGETLVDSDTLLWIHETPNEFSVYLQDHWKISPLFQIQGGLRGYRYSFHDEYYIDPRLSAKYFLRDDLSLEIAWGRYHQFLTTANPPDELLRFIDIWLPIPQDRVAPVAEHYVIGSEWISGKGYLLSADVYWKTFDNLVKLRGVNLFADDVPIDTSLNDFLDSDATALGLELLGKKRFGKVRGWLGYTFSRTQWYDEEHGWYVPKYDRTHTVNLVLSYQLTDQWQMNGAFTYASGNPYTPLLARYHTASNYGWDRYDSYFFTDNAYISGEFHSDRYPAYHRLDIGFRNTKEWWNGYRTWYFQVQNVYNHMNVFLYSYNEEWDYRGIRDKGVQRRPIPMFPFFPSVGFIYEF